MIIDSSLGGEAGNQQRAHGNNHRQAERDGAFSKFPHSPGTGFFPFHRHLSIGCFIYCIKSMPKAQHQREIQ